MLEMFNLNLSMMNMLKLSMSQVYWIMVILNKHKTSSQKQAEQLSFFKQYKQGKTKNLKW